MRGKLAKILRVAYNERCLDGRIVRRDKNGDPWTPSERQFRRQVMGLIRRGRISRPILHVNDQGSERKVWVEFKRGPNALGGHPA